MYTWFIVSFLRSLLNSKSPSDKKGKRKKRCPDLIDCPSKDHSSLVLNGLMRENEQVLQVTQLF